MLLINPYRFKVPRDPVSDPVTDSDALAYIAAVETADGQTLEDSVKFAYEDFIVGCKSDGIWSAIKASLILAGARSLSGALVPLVGTAPTNFNFVSADYNRETGLKSNGTTKYINLNRVNNIDPQNSKHLFVEITETGSKPASGFRGYAHGQFNTGLVIQGSANQNHNIYFRINGSTNSARSMAQPLGGLGASRFSSTQIQTLGNDSLLNINQSSTTPGTGATFLFRESSYVDSRISFFSTGENLDLALLKPRVSNLMTALAAAIP